MKTSVKIFLILVAVILIANLCSCTDNQRARQWGGKQVVEIKQDYKLVSCQWKHNDGDEDLWILITPMEPGDKPKTSYFVEKSNWGLLEGEIEFHESKSVSKYVKDVLKPSGDSVSSNH